MKKILAITAKVFPKIDGVPENLLGQLGLSAYVEGRLDYSNSIRKLCESIDKIKPGAPVFEINDKAFYSIIPMLPSVFVGTEPEYIESLMSIERNLKIDLSKVQIDSCMIPKEIDTTPNGSKFEVSFITDWSFEYYKHYFVDLKQSESDKPNLVSINRFTNKLGSLGIENDDTFFDLKSNEYSCDLSHLIKYKIWIYSVKYYVSTGRVVVSRHRFTYLPRFRQIFEIRQKLFDTVMFSFGGHFREHMPEFRYLNKSIRLTKKMFECITLEYHDIARKKSGKLCRISFPEGYDIKNSIIAAQC